MTCPQSVDYQSLNDPTLSTDGATLFDKTPAATGYNRYSWPAFTYIDTIALTDLALPAPFDSNVSFNDFGGMVQAGDGYLYAWLTDLFASQAIIARFLPDGTDASIFYDPALSLTAELQTLLTWHPADPDNLWTVMVGGGVGADDLASIDLATATRTDVLALTTGLAYDRQFNQYDTGLVIASSDEITVFDIPTATSDVASTPNIDSVGTSWSERTIFWTDDATTQSDQVLDIVVSGSVSLVTGSTSCDAFKNVDGFYGGPSAWFAPEDRSHIYLSDLSSTWDWSTPGGWSVGRISWGSPSGWN